MEARNAPIWGSTRYKALAIQINTEVTVCLPAVKVKMPVIAINTNINQSKIPSTFLQEMTLLISDILKKPESVSLVGDNQESFTI